jgi:hypothetical protein
MEMILRNEIFGITEVNGTKRGPPFSEHAQAWLKES